MRRAFWSRMIVKSTLDLRALGARSLSTRLLVQELVPRADDAELEAAVAALALHPRARDPALLDLKHGPRLLAAVEIGRRAWLLSPVVGVRIQGPVDVVAVAGPRVVDDDRACVIAVDVRGRVARVGFVDDIASADALRIVLGAGCRRAVVALRVARPAVPTTADVQRALVLRERGGVVDVDVLDVVLLGDDGFCSLLRLGLLGPAHDGRYA
jgi:hypothetical protein